MKGEEGREGGEGEGREGREGGGKGGEGGYKQAMVGYWHESYSMWLVYRRLIY